MGLATFDNILYICIYGGRFSLRNPCFRTSTIRYLSCGRGVTPYKYPPTNKTKKLVGISRYLREDFGCPETLDLEIWRCSGGSGWRGSVRLGLGCWWLGSTFTYILSKNTCSNNVNKCRTYVKKPHETPDKPPRRPDITLSHIVTW